MYCIFVMIYIYIYATRNTFSSLFAFVSCQKIDVLAVVVDTKGVREGLHIVAKLDAVLCNF